MALDVANYGKPSVAPCYAKNYELRYDVAFDEAEYSEMSGRTSYLDVVLGL